MKKLLQRLILLGLALFFGYLVYLNYLIKSTFSSEVQKSDQITQIDYSIKRYPKEMVNMLLLVEDQSFFQHWGIDFKEIVRVFYGYLLEDKAIRGASTITQQLIKNTLLSRDKTLSRKIDEALMAMLMELNYDKNFILERYMNTVYLAQQGSMAFHGFASASQFYFDKKVDDLDLREMATLVALLKGPSYYHPVKHPERLNNRLEMILSMHNKYKKIIQ
jgi:membrane peptidoglycan carboxypeptidase|tara:strand:+ start:63 stop:719 length:657 start_codon:yes stop_codon:yes gene_type:complete